MLPKRSIHQNKLLGSVWWTSAGMIHWELIKPDSLITAEIDCKHLDKMMLELKKNSLDWSKDRLLSYCKITPDHIVQMILTTTGI